MNLDSRPVVIALIILIIGGVGGYALGSYSKSSWSQGYSDEERGTLKNDNMSRQPAEDMGMGMGHEGHMMGMTVESEREFLEEMIPHHQEAVDTAKEVIARGGSTPEIKALAGGIVTAQEAEITSMKQWYEAWYGEAYQDEGSYAAMMSDLSTLSGAELDRAFLQDMIMHHMGAIMMARSVETVAEHDEVKALAEAIIRTQSEEIQTMRAMLMGL